MTKTSGFTVAEVDEHGRLVACIAFGEADLVAALAELDTRHRELAGGVDSPETMFLEGVAAMNRRDWDGFAAHLAPEFVLVDHQPLSFGTTDGAGTVDVMRSMTDVMPDAVVVVQRTFESAGATLAAMKTTGRTPEGSRYEWRAYFVVRNSSTGVTDRAESFPADQWDAALACFEQLSRADAIRPIENTATRAFAEIAALATGRRFDDLPRRGVPGVREDRPQDRRVGGPAPRSRRVGDCVPFDDRVGARPARGRAPRRQGRAARAGPPAVHLGGR